MERYFIGLHTQLVIGDWNSANHFAGYGDGRSILLGGSRNDTFTLTFDESVDLIDGGAGRDLVDYSFGSAALQIDLESGVTKALYDDASWDMNNDDPINYFWEPVTLMVNIEDVVGTIFNDTIRGNWADNTIGGGAGADAINGAGGVDTASYRNSGAGVTVDLGSWSPFNDAQGAVGWGSGGDAEGDVLISMENVTGSQYSDWFSGSSANNVIDGGWGLDTVSYRDAAEGVAINLQTGIVQGGQSVGTDTLISIEYVEGSRFNDTYVAGDRQDIFVFGDNIGHDTIDNFDARDTNYYHDYISVEGVFGSWEEASEHITRNGNDWTIAIDQDNSITLTDVRGTLDANDFFFG